MVLDEPWIFKSNGHNLSVRHENFCGQCYFSHSTPELKMHCTESEATQSHLQTSSECTQTDDQFVIQFSTMWLQSPPIPKNSTNVTDGFPLPLNKTCSLYTAQHCKEIGDDSTPLICAAVTREKARWPHYGTLPPNWRKFPKSTTRVNTALQQLCDGTIHNPRRQLSKLPALFTMLPRSSARVIHLSTRNATVHNNHTRHTTLHLYFILCQFLFILQSQSIYVYIMFCQFLLTSYQNKANDHLLTR